MISLRPLTRSSCFASRTCSVRSLAAVVAVTLMTSLPGFAEVTVRSIPLDCGGWLSGFSVHSSGRVYAYGDVFGFWRSDDSGQSWKYLLNDQTKPDYFGTGSAVAEKDPDTVLFVTEHGLHKTTDGGSTWRVVRSRMQQRRSRGASPVVFQPGSTTEYWLAASFNRETGTLWHTVDDGANWSKVGGEAFDKFHATTINVRPEFPDQIWVGAVGGLYISVDHGKTFTCVWDNEGKRSTIGTRPEVSAIARRSDGIGYVATNIAGYQITASDFNDPKTYVVTQVVSRVKGQGPQSATVLADNSFLTSNINGNYLSHSVDGSAGTWDPPIPGDVGPEPERTLLPVNTPIYKTPTVDGKVPGGRDMVVQDPSKHSRWFMTGGQAPVISEDFGATWSFPPNGSGLAGIVVDAKVRFPRANPMKALLSVQDQGVIVINDGGASGKADDCSRRSIEKHASFQGTMSSDDGQKLVAAGCDQSAGKSMIYRSNDGGKNWEELDLSSSGLPPSPEGITRATATPGNTTDFTVLLGYRADLKVNNPGVYRTTDGGATFKKAIGIPDGVDTGHKYQPDASHLEADGIKANVRYLSLKSERDEKARGFYRSTDGGSSWEKTSAQPFDNKEWITDMVVDPSSAGNVWVAGKRGIRRSEDGGDTWTTVGAFKDVQKFSAVKGSIAVWGRRGSDEWNKLYFSADNGAKWVEVTGPGRRLAFLRNVTVNPHKTNELWISGISVNILTVGQATIDSATADSI